MATPPWLLVASEDSRDLAETQRLATERGWGVLRARSGRELEERLERTAVRLPGSAAGPGQEELEAAVVDIFLPGGPDAIRTLLLRSLPVLVISPPGEAEADTLRALGALDVLPAPFDAAGLDRSLALLRERVELARRIEQASAPSAARAEALLQGPSMAAGRLREAVGRVAGTRGTTVLLQAFPRSGASACARAIHGRSSRRHGPFVALDDAAELAPATSGRPSGLLDPLRAARRGTLFLGRVETLAPALQEELAVLLGDRRLEAEAEAPDTEARLIASTEVDLEERVEQGRFADALFYRLNVLRIELPSAASRRDDRAAILATLPEGQRLSAEAVERLTELDPPFDELAALLVLAGLRAGPGPIGPQAFAGSQPASADVLALGDRALRTVERALIERVLEESEGNHSLAARVLGVNRTTLYNKLRRYREEDQADPRAT